MTTTTEHAHLCPGCFTDKGNASTCPHCCYDENLKRGPLVLPHRTLLHHGQYLIGKVLGKPGGFGITYLALDTKLQTRVAIKEYLPRDLAGRDAGHATISAHSAEDGEFFRYGLTQFLQEARTLAQFDHANIVRVRNFFEENGTGYLVMDYYDGITLADYLAQQAQGKLSEQTAVGIMMPILDGLREVHARNILHRDIKPQNIYLTTANRPILLDFGAARQAMGERSRSLSVVLSEGYAPYEQYHRRGEQGPWTDIYACAAVLYHAVSGQAPPPATERMHKDELDIAALGVSASLTEALRLGLAADHHKRPQKMTEFQGLLLGENAATVEIKQKPEQVALSAPSARKQSLEPAQSKGTSSKKTGWAVALATVVVMATVAMFTKEEKEKVLTVEAPAPVATETRIEPVPSAPVAPVAEIKPDKVPPPASVDSATGASEDAEVALWKSVESSTSKDDYDSYLKQYPKGKYVTLAKSRIKKLQFEAAARQAEVQRAEAEQQEQNAWESANSMANETNYQGYLNTYPQGRYATLAQEKLAAIREKIATKAKVSQSYVISTDGTEVTDKKTGLIWRRCAEGMVYSGGTCTGAASEFTYDGALQHAAAQASSNGIAWRVPNREELSSIVDKNFGNPTIDHTAFPASSSSGFWSASANGGGKPGAWVGYFGYGVAGYLGKGYAGHVRLVRYRSDNGS